MRGKAIRIDGLCRLVGVHSVSNSVRQRAAELCIKSLAAARTKHEICAPTRGLLRATSYVVFGNEKVRGMFVFYNMEKVGKRGFEAAPMPAFAPWGIYRKQALWGKVMDALLGREIAFEGGTRRALVNWVFPTEEHQSWEQRAGERTHEIFEQMKSVEIDLEEVRGKQLPRRMRRKLIASGERR